MVLVTPGDDGQVTLSCDECKAGSEQCGWCEVWLSEKVQRPFVCTQTDTFMLAEAGTSPTPTHMNSSAGVWCQVLFQSFTGCWGSFQCPECRQSFASEAFPQP